LFWAEELAGQSDDAELAGAFDELARVLRENEATINEELLAVQGSPVDIGGYYRPDSDKVTAVMRPSKTLVDVLEGLGGSAG
jgi:isocitrate dehydrogenase